MAEPIDSVKKLTTSDGKYKGYQFQDDDFANQLAFLFATESGEAKAKAILKEAEEKFPPPPPGQLDIKFKERRQYIEAQVKKEAIERDNKLQAGLLDIFNAIKDKKNPGTGICNDEVFDLLQSMGVNVDKDNLQTSYDPGPPQVLMIFITIRPAENLKNENSEVNKLANYYKNNCGLDATQKQNFGNSWNQHVENAKNGGPKVEKDKFMADADKAFKATVAESKAAAPEEPKVDAGLQNK